MQAGVNEVDAVFVGGNAVKVGGELVGGGRRARAAGGALARPDHRRARAARRVPAAGARGMVRGDP